MLLNTLLKLIETENGRIKVFSCDVFDTLVLRLVRAPLDVFTYMYESNREYFPECISARDWMNIRAKAEGKARGNSRRKKNNNDVTLAEIYSNIPPAIKNPEMLMNREVQAEADLCYINEEVSECLKQLHALGVKIVLTSDMYLSKEMLRIILANAGMNLEIIDNIFVSSDYYATKMSGKLYDIVLKEYDIAPGEMLHMGDNFISDIGVAKKRGIKTYYYSLISEAEYRFPYLMLEKMRTDDLLCSQYSLRLMAARLGESTCEDNLFWHNLGAMLLGPILTNYAEWVLDYALQNDIHLILPMMREGDFLGRLIKNAAQARNAEVDINNLYVSRLALTMANIDDIGKETISYMIRTHGVTVKDVFETLKIYNYIGDYKSVENVKTSDLDYLESADGLDLNSLEDYLTSDEMMEIIHDLNSQNEKSALKYLEDSGFFGKCITLDVGWKGSIQSLMTDFLNKHGIKNVSHNLLVFSNKDAADNIYNGSVITGYVGNLGNESLDIDKLYPRLIELFLGSDKGTTMGYKYENNSVIPVVKDIEYSAWQKECVKTIQKGIEDYQRVFLANSKNKSVRKLSNHRKKESLCILQRLFCNPLYIESKRLGCFKYDQNFGSNSFEMIIDDFLVEKMNRIGAVNYWSNFQGSQFEWLCGLYVQHDALIYYKNVLLHNPKFGLLKQLYLLVAFLDRIGNQKFALVGAGANLRWLLIYCEALNICDRIIGIIDNDENKQGASIRNISIMGIDKDFDCKNFLITVGQKAVHDQLMKQVYDTVGKDVFVFGYFMGDWQK